MTIHVFGKMKYIGDLSLESINSDIEKNNYDVPIYGDFATSVAKKLNEMYAKFGNPYKIQKNKTDKYTETMVMYGHLDEKGNMYAAYFVHSDKKFDGKNYIKTKPNVITAVNIFYLSNNK